MKSQIHIKNTGDYEWRTNNGKLHREDGPAWKTSVEESWWINGELHRLDGPAIIRDDGYQAWYFNGKFHRLDGPAIIYSSGTQEWFVNGELHRLDGPAHINPRLEYYLWFLNNRNITTKVVNWMRNHNITWPLDEEDQAQFLLTFTLEELI